MSEKKEKFKVGDLIKIDAHAFANTSYHNRIALITRRAPMGALIKGTAFFIRFLGDEQEYRFNFYEEWFKKIS